MVEFLAYIRRQHPVVGSDRASPGAVYGDRPLSVRSRKPALDASLSLALAYLAAVPLEEPSRKGLPWQQQLRTPNGLLAGVAFVVFLGLFLWPVIHR